MGDGLKGFFQRVEAEPSAEFTEELLARLRTEFETGERRRDRRDRRAWPWPMGDVEPGAPEDAEPVIVALTTTNGRGNHGDDSVAADRATPMGASRGGRGGRLVVVVAAATALLATRDRGRRPRAERRRRRRTAGSTPTVERLHGIWLEDPGTGTVGAPLMARFETDGRFSLGGVLAEDSWTYGTYEVKGHRITFTVTGGRCNSRDVFSGGTRRSWPRGA